MISSNLRLIDDPDRAAVGATAHEFLKWLGGPSLMRIAGRDPSRRRALAVLLHGNEPSGLVALHRFLVSGSVPAVELHVFVGAVEAALAEPRFAHRMLPGRRDLNRCFVPPFADRDGSLALEALNHLLALDCECLVDLHNTTGETPPYGIMTVRDRVHLGLISLFGKRAILSDIRLGTLIEAFDHVAPAVTIECGRAFDPASDAVAIRGLEHYAMLDTPPIEGEHEEIVELGDPIRVMLNRDTRVAFGAGAVDGVDLTFKAELDQHNFEMVDAGACLGWIQSGRWPLDARDARGAQRSTELFYADDGILRARRAMMPIMVTTDATVAAEDCLCYVVSPRGRQ